tara:strand:+ start:872 stop:1339 length:468 start_codon:yes stop_codon:yes gene_type:complete
MTQIPVRNPHTGDIDYAFEELTKSELASKISRLRENQVDWTSLEVSDRGEILTQFADGLARHKDQLAQALCVDTGRWRLSLMEVDALEAITRSRVNQAIVTLQTKRMQIGKQRHFSSAGLCPISCRWRYFALELSSNSLLSGRCTGAFSWLLCHH